MTGREYELISRALEQAPVGCPVSGLIAEGVSTDPFKIIVKAFTTSIDFRKPEKIKAGRGHLVQCSGQDSGVCLFCSSRFPC
ncbi:hypothetical protein A2395_01845 [Candidatus Amesbacteria bacterium RIFOXYB1_FULL_47_9]|uniref:Uncharacterized protein n=1 Tax=Candidatus Amesbacteria bacterium RIFOXYB1_FULL_47_9 TaxID=1797266 RepID=A0A1F4ZQS6_9BACT|nr:MAG: hypothetical protein A2395_01845 [Candidatus Amesbacteria bacterium RIFOXYB1_FULL_47_9]